MNDRKDDFADRDREGSIFREGWHRRLAKAGSPATARGCGELWRALLAAAVAAPKSDFDEVLSITCALNPLQKYL